MSFPFHIAEHVLDAQYIRLSPGHSFTSFPIEALHQTIPLDNPNRQPGDVTIVIDVRMEVSTDLAVDQLFSLQKGILVGTF
ncbi:uncharacterized protein N7459_001630 [Penicillium hispanicum]|uniref:uncharacterized protein n=1 Tax=Penicillium hispanicum TaxID=1080232 RepID=UPI002542452E|nr:uncharacterized protein N7459_001630 [Penicillium hispanicum]KAJ5595422.1 hypothetical protein N7459_001630 [Penicillium hispanicum]